VKRLEIRGLPADLFRGYLVDEFGGAAQADGTVTGKGWTARFIDGEPVKWRHDSVRVLFVEFEGPAEDQASAFLARKAMRGGG
jgi:hypothetical protein